MERGKEEKKGGNGKEGQGKKRGVEERRGCQTPPGNPTRIVCVQECTMEQESIQWDRCHS